MHEQDPFLSYKILLATIFAFMLGAIVTGLIGIAIDFLELADDSAAWVAAVGTMLAAIGTISTLIFLSWQHRQERQARLRADVRQAEMWELQRDNISLQKYDAHKKMFFNMLSSLELGFNKSIEFYDKDALYNNLFPENNIENCVTKINIESPAQQSAGTLHDCLECYDHLSKQLDTIHGSSPNEFYINAYNLLNNLLRMESSLRINFNSSNVIGYISPNFDQSFLMLNVFNPRYSFICLEETLNRICMFVSVAPPSKISHMASGSFVSNTLTYFTLEHTNLRGYSFHFGEHEKTLRCMYKCYKIFDMPEHRKIPQINTHYIDLCELFTNSEALYKKLECKSELHQLFQELLYSLAGLDDFTDKPTEISVLRKEIRALTSALKPKRN
ncbi:hypothetical protein MACH09_19900 [Vibrio sp. MACH09]|uniref:hypothetical protein n=1 Tax=Vibrio sp. MACH09 TaxID=3025122 RepID=UPI00278CB330|nr:hypothetical protein [Vibrio sp. MACH09]GLO61482.1 hypothetical protein MACH09_19900 [Vibrio sp. MACH09]